MKKFLYALITVLFLSILGVIGFIVLELQDDSPKKENNKDEELTEEVQDQISYLKSKISADKEEQRLEIEQETKHTKQINSRLSSLRDRVKLKDLIESGDNYADERNYMPAILNYEKALKEKPTNKELIKKIGDAHYEMYNYKKAYESYAKIKHDENFDAKKFIFSLINYKGILPVNIKEVKSEIASLGLDRQTKFYYNTAIDCYLDYDTCEQEYESYFAANTDITSPELLKVKTAFENYKNFQSSEKYYKATYLCTAFYENGFYYMALKMAEKVENMKKGYQPILRIAALSAHEIGDYVEAKDYLLKLKKLDSHSPEISYLLARVYERLNEKTLSVVHYEKALKDNYEEPNDIYRRLIFIYFEHKEQQKMLETFDTLLSQEQDTLNEVDYALAVYYNILNEDFTAAKKYARTASEIYKDTPIFYGYQAWIGIMQSKGKEEKLEIVKRLIEKAEDIDSKNALTLMVRGIYEYQMRNDRQAKNYLRKAREADTSWEYKEEIDYYLDKLEK